MADQMTDEFTQQRVSQRRGPTLSFQGKLLCSTEWQARKDQVTVILELWETPERNWIAVTAFERDDDIGERDTAQAVVIERQDDEQAMRFAAMDAWDWEMRARSMVKSQLRWNLTVQVA